MLWLSLLLSVAATAQTTYQFPLQVSQNGRHLVDQQRTPFFYQADTPWFLFYKLSLPEIEEYVDQRRAQGFNALQIMLTGARDSVNLYGVGPFRNQDDLTQPNEAFFVRVDSVLQLLERKNMLAALVPIWAGCCASDYAGTDRAGNPLPLNRAGADGARTFARYLADRYCGFPNLLWIIGGDNDPYGAYAEYAALAEVLDDRCPNTLMTYHAASTHSSTDVFPDADWLDLSMVYTYFRGFDRAWNRVQPDAYEVSRAERRKTPARPFFLGESTYEGEHLPWGSAEQVRKQAYYAVLSGAAGHAYGSDNWHLPHNWRQVLQYPGAFSMEPLRRRMEERRWYEYVPDPDHAVLTQGAGDYASNDYGIVAVHPNGRSAMIYVPSPRTLEIDVRSLARGRRVVTIVEPESGLKKRVPMGAMTVLEIPAENYPTFSDVLIFVDVE